MLVLVGCVYVGGMDVINDFLFIDKAKLLGTNSTDPVKGEGGRVGYRATFWSKKSCGR